MNYINYLDKYCEGHWVWASMPNLNTHYKFLKLRTQKLKLPEEYYYSYEFNLNRLSRLDYSERMLYT